MCGRVLNVALQWGNLALVTCIEILHDMVVKEASFMVKGLCNEKNYIVGGDDMSNVVLGLREGLLSVHLKS